VARWQASDVLPSPLVALVTMTERSERSPVEWRIIVRIESIDSVSRFPP
jgi:hypothetical protein